jgi:hypothetical protein
MLKQRGGHSGDRLPLNAIAARKARRWGDGPLSGATRQEVGRGPANYHGNGRLAPTQDRRAWTARGLASKQGRGSNGIQIQNNLN